VGKVGTGGENELLIASPAPGGGGEGGSYRENWDSYQRVCKLPSTSPRIEITRVQRGKKLGEEDRTGTI